MTIDSIGYRFDKLMNELGFTKNSQIVQLREQLPELEATTASVSRWRAHQIAGEPGPGPGMKSAKILANHFGFSLDYLLLGRGAMFINMEAKSETHAIQALDQLDGDPLVLDKRVLRHLPNLDSLVYLSTSYLTRSASDALESRIIIIDTSVHSIAISGLYLLSRGPKLYETTNVTVTPTGEAIFNQHKSKSVTTPPKQLKLVERFIVGLVVLQI